MDEYTEDDLGNAAARAAQSYDLDQDEARNLVELVAGALGDGGDAIDDAVWDVQDRDARIDGQDFVEDVATNLGYDFP
ncbi:hypothetical protein AMES_7175 [Amycolatopsis mediterranei S699]|uniref:Uncharacterized protein n=2 Tax=Amycolatopsis mediterranei TaxID=33910 RepID=A0A0H3DE75_AMYMU|nr:hypothetical protein [Amycolatopsis mediterranei]ADJ49001.1 hypothetical protein AMED_7285 [Amycolatopsis mediterranei U32]AEK45951.1 hypothetical protein RAM_37420 [Amycolatopsis mediterranei S699]AFO80709.1 hypothetical protein AMES_7175 [Amycolatopsis mediterranei S699]AGT87837.1 hypothetical protein B737_7175 [Amycolatopsis mediterranei RB]KDU93881.1 hypothetical protein DV36_00650 [Amycolatopsis mediterranei]